MEREIRRRVAAELARRPHSVGRHHQRQELRLAPPPVQHCSSSHSAAAGGHRWGDGSSAGGVPTKGVFVHPRPPGGTTMAGGPTTMMSVAVENARLKATMATIKRVRLHDIDAKEIAQQRRHVEELFSVGGLPL